MSEGKSGGERWYPPKEVALPEGLQAKVDEAMKPLLAVVEMLNGLGVQIDQADLASRFSRTRTTEDIEGDTAVRLTGGADRRVQEEGEAGLKRMQLEADALAIMQKIMGAGGDLRCLLIDLHYAQEEG